MRVLDIARSAEFLIDSPHEHCQSFCSLFGKAQTTVDEKVAVILTLSASPLNLLPGDIVYLVWMNY